MNDCNLKVLNRNHNYILNISIESVNKYKTDIPLHIKLDFNGFLWNIFNRIDSKFIKIDNNCKWGETMKYGCLFSAKPMKCITK